MQGGMVEEHAILSVTRQLEQTSRLMAYTQNKTRQTDPEGGCLPWFS